MTLANSPSTPVHQGERRGDAMSDVGRILAQARRELLDLSGRNRLLNTPRHRARSNAIEVIDERSDSVFRLLVEDGKALGFRARRLTVPGGQPRR